MTGNFCALLTRTRQWPGLLSLLDWNLIFADLVLTSLPVVILYLFAQRFIIGGLTAGAVKG